MVIVAAIAGVSKHYHGNYKTGNMAEWSSLKTALCSPLTVRSSDHYSKQSTS